MKNMNNKIGRFALTKKLSIDQLSKKVGGLYLKSVAGNSAVKTGLQRGTALKKTLIQLGAGKTKYQFEKELKKYGVSGSQLKKRNDILSLAYGVKKSGLTEEQIKRNLKASKVVDRTALEKQRDRFDRNKTLASVGSGVHGDASRINVGVKHDQLQISALQNNVVKNTPKPAAPTNISPSIKPVI